MKIGVGAIGDSSTQNNDGYRVVTIEQVLEPTARAVEGQQGVDVQELADGQDHFWKATT